MRCLLLFLFVSATLSGATDAAREKFLAAFAPLDGGPARISPDGRSIAYAQREKAEVAVYIVALDTSKIAFRAVVGKEDRPHLVGNTRYASPGRVDYLRWADNEHVVVGTTANHFIVLNHRAKSGRHLVNFEGEERLLGDEYGILSGQVGVFGKRTGRIVALTTGTPAFAFVEGTTPAGPETTTHLLLKVNVETGATETMLEEKVAGRLLYDTAGRVRARYVSSYATDAVFLFQPEAGKQKWQPLDQIYPAAFAPPPPMTPETYFGERAFPLGFDGDTLYFASSIGRNTLGLYSLDLRSGERNALAVEDPVVDVVSPYSRPGNDGLLLDRVSGKVAGVWTLGMKAGRVWLDPDLAALHETISARTPGYRVNVVNWDDAREKFVVELYNPVDPAACYLYTRSTRKLDVIVPQRKNQTALGRATAQAWTLRRPDGSTLGGMLAIPRSLARPVPVVVRIRSSPWSTPFFGYDSQTTALTQMGYAVLEVDHRGTAGYGARHLQAGRHRFDAIAMEDIAAALRALPSGSGVDARRVALFGRDYGGYLALRGLQLHPGRFACAVTIEPITDLLAWLRPRVSDAPYFKFEHAARQWYFGAERERLREHNPDPKAIGAPVLLAANPNSYRQNWGELSAFRRKLAAAGPRPAFVEVTQGAFVAGAEQAQLWMQIEDFLRQHLGAP